MMTDNKLDKNFGVNLKIARLRNIKVETLLERNIQVAAAHHQVIQKLHSAIKQHYAELGVEDEEC